MYPLHLLPSADFRPAYLQLGELRQDFPGASLVAGAPGLNIQPALSIHAQGMLFLSFFLSSPG